MNLGLSLVQLVEYLGDQLQVGSLLVYSDHLLEVLDVLGLVDSGLSDCYCL